MTKALTMDAAIAAILHAVDRPAEDRSAIVETFRRQSCKRPDAFARAELLLLEAMVFNSDGPLDGVIDQLELAVQVFEANERPDRAAMCWLYLAKWYAVRGDTAESLACGRRALAVPEIDIHTRLGLTHSMLPGLAELLCFDEAMLRLRRDFLPFMRAASPSPRLALSWMDAAFLHLLAAVRAGRLQSIFTMDMDDTVAECNEEVRSRMRPGLEESKRCLQRALEVGGEATAYPIAHTRGLVEALEGNCNAAFSSFGLQPRQGLTEVTRLHNLGWAMRINGRSSEALPCLQGALRLSVELGSGEFERASQYELSLCRSALGDADAAYEGLSRFTVLHARASVQSARLSSRPERGPCAPRSAIDDEPTQPDRSTQEIQWLRIVPPYVARAKRLFKETMGNRLSLSEMAARAGTGPRSLQVGLNNYLGTTFVAAYRTAAMEEARRLLSLTALPVQEIAGRVGYKSTPTFSRDYKAFSGMSPTTFRNADAAA